MAAVASAPSFAASVDVNPPSVEQQQSRASRSAVSKASFLIEDQKKGSVTSGPKPSRSTIQKRTSISQSALSKPSNATMMSKSKMSMSKRMQGSVADLQKEDSLRSMDFKPNVLRPIPRAIALGRLNASKKLIDILNPKRPLLPVELPPVGDARKENYIAKLPQRTGGESISVADLGMVPFVEGDDAPNPFRYPPSIEEFIAERDAEREGAKQKLTDTPALMKGTSLYKQNQTVLARIKPFLSPEFKPSIAHDYKKVVWRAQNGLHINHLQKVSRKLHTDYIMQRKNIFYLKRDIRARQIALEMIQKTREFEEACLKDYEWLTEFTKDAFNTFLKLNDDQTHDAAKRVEQAQKEKLDKTIEARELQMRINQLKADIIGTNENLRECKSYMKFFKDVADEIMQQDADDEIRAQYRELQVKEEIVEHLKDGKTLEEARRLVAEKASEQYRDYPELDPSSTYRVSTLSKTSFYLHSESTEFLNSLQKEVRRNLDISEYYYPNFEDILDDVEQPPAHRPQQIKETTDADSPPISAAGSGGNLEAAAEEEEREEEEEEEGQEEDREEDDFIGNGNLLSPRSVIKGLVGRCKSKLVPVVNSKEHKDIEKSVIEKEPSPEPIDKEDADGYNEYALIASLNLVPGDEETDRLELANLYFTRPSQMVELYKDMEESNATLAEHLKLAESMLDNVTSELVTTRKKLNQKGHNLRQDINKVQADIEACEEKSKALEIIVEMFSGGNYDVPYQQKLYRVLQRHVTKTYEAVIGKSSIEHSLSPIQMLTSIEKHFEDLMKEINAMPADVVVQISRELEKERRELERLEKMNSRKVRQDERKSRRLDKAKEPKHLKKGRPLLARSRPKVVIQLPKVEMEEKPTEEDDCRLFFNTASTAAPSMDEETTGSLR